MSTDPQVGKATTAWKQARKDLALAQQAVKVRGEALRAAESKLKDASYAEREAWDALHKLRGDHIDSVDDADDVG